MNNSCDMLVIYVGTAALKLQPIFAFNVDFSLVKSFEPITRFVYISMYDFSKTFVILLTKVKQTSKQDSIQHYSSTDLVIFIISIAIQLKLTLLLLVKITKSIRCHHQHGYILYVHIVCYYFEVNFQKLLQNPIVRWFKSTPFVTGLFLFWYD